MEARKVGHYKVLSGSMGLKIGWHNQVRLYLLQLLILSLLLLVELVEFLLPKAQFLCLVDTWLNRDRVDPHIVSRAILSNRVDRFAHLDD